MIAIINDGSNKESTGVHRYRLQINNKVICEFEHVRENGLAECLRAAANAAEKAHNDHIEEILKLLLIPN